MESEYSRFTSPEREKIEHMLNEGSLLGEIAAVLGKSPTSISREVRRNRIELRIVSKSKFKRNPCKKRESCQKKNLCRRIRCKRRCASCEFIFCHEKCDEFILWHCGQIDRWPYVCNRCTWYSTCPEQRYAYRAMRAQKIAESRASLSRKGIYVDVVELERIDSFVSPLLNKGQAPYHIWNNHRDELGFCLATFYAYINTGLFSAGRMSLKRAVNMKTRKGDYIIKDKRDFSGRTYTDFLVLKEACHDDGL